MRTFIITLKEVEFSKQMAERCRESARKVGYKPEIETFWGVLGSDWKNHIPEGPKTLAWNLAKKTIAPIGGCFTSHYLLWKKCLELNEPILILEHDAHFESNIPEEVLNFDKCVNLGSPSFFREDCCNFIEPKEGLHPLRDNIFFGHHGYAIKPDGAEILVDEVENGKKRLWRNDLFVNKKSHPWLEEYYPWCISANVEYSTVNFTGLKAEHVPRPDTMSEEKIEYRSKHFPNKKSFGSVRIMHEDMKEALRGK